MIIPKKERQWRMRQRKGSIMKPKTFSKIEKQAMKRYGIGKARAAKVAGASYWQAERAKYKAAHRR